MRWDFAWKSNFSFYDWFFRRKFSLLCFLKTWLSSLQSTTAWWGLWSLRWWNRKIMETARKQPKFDSCSALTLSRIFLKVSSVSNIPLNYFQFLFRFQATAKSSRLAQSTLKSIMNYSKATFCRRTKLPKPAAIVKEWWKSKRLLMAGWNRSRWSLVKAITLWVFFVMIKGNSDKFKFSDARKTNIWPTHGAGALAPNADQIFDRRRVYWIKSVWKLFEVPRTVTIKACWGLNKIFKNYRYQKLIFAEMEESWRDCQFDAYWSKRQRSIFDVNWEALDAFVSFDATRHRWKCFSFAQRHSKSLHDFSFLQHQRSNHRIFVKSRQPADPCFAKIFDKRRKNHDLGRKHQKSCEEDRRL